ncbi:hypothetical protein CEN44_22400 [Fischerella muscicola CCMEE 5323]|uniref:Isopropylmalate/homocitrate/citramalate synthase n=1 Tax=Fischerella muscicola CCMEE 5323 TaxID=2019572 RepID=A0A2N6JXS7_FISMU|nr:hypothetical protein [Fischerella muscicola]PLZ85397.1 hypothetical protein CEN44_22400 [Fischerella muscicola CCMEE 5323]
MVQPNQKDLNKFLYPHSSYRGQVKPENLVFNANLQEFAQKVSFIANLETSGKLAPEEAYSQIKMLWKQLKLSKKELKIGSQTLSDNQ